MAVASRPDKISYFRRVELRPTFLLRPEFEILPMVISTLPLLLVV